MKLYVILALIAAYTAFVIFATWQVATGREARKDLKVIEKQVEDSNEDAIEIQKEVETIEKERTVVVEKIVRLPAVRASDCPLSDVIELQSQAYQAIMQVHEPEPLP